MAVMTIAICDEIRKDAQKLSRQLSTLVPDAEDTGISQQAGAS